MHIAVLLHGGKNWSVVMAAGRLDDSQLEPFQNVPFNLFLVSNKDLELFDVDWLSSLERDVMRVSVQPRSNLS